MSRRIVSRSGTRDEPPHASGTDLPARRVRSGGGPFRDALAPYVGPLTVALAVTVALALGLAIALVGARQPSITTNDPDIVDEFDLDDGDAPGELADGGEWETVGGWTVVAGAVSLTEAPDGGRGFALLPDVSGPARIAATVTGAGPGGLVARYRGPDDHVRVEPRPSVAAWVVEVVRDGEVVQTSEPIFGPVADGTRVELVVQGARAWVIVGGRLRAETSIDEAPDDGRVGLTATVPAGGSSRFDDVARDRP